MDNFQKYGWEKDKVDVKDLKFNHEEYLPSVSLPPTVDLTVGLNSVLNQSNLGSCHDSITEVLTADGWKLFSNITMDDKLASVSIDTKNLIFEKPTDIIKKQYDGNMYYTKNSRMDFALTEDHDMIVRDFDSSTGSLSNIYKKVKIKDIGWYSGLICGGLFYDGDENSSEFYAIAGVDNKTTPNQRTETIFPMELWLKLIGIYLAEGTMLVQSHSGYGVQIAGVKDRERVFISDLLTDLGINFHSREDRFVFTNKQIYTEFQNLGFLGVKAPDKRVPSFVFSQNSDNIKSFLEAYFMGDGCQSKKTRNFYTSSVGMSYDIQRLILLSGGWSNIYIRCPRTSVMTDGRTVVGKYDEHCIGQWYDNKLSIERKSQIYNLPYSGLVYCASVPTYQTLITKRNGKILISGNCTANSISGALDYTLKKEGKKFITPSRLFIYYNERSIENTVSDDSGAQIRDGIKSVNKQGVCKESTWKYDISKFTIKPSNAAYKEALNYTVSEYKSVDNTNLDSIKTALASGFPIVVGFSVYESFEGSTVTKTGIVPMPILNEPILGGHSTLMTGYNDTNEKVNGMPPKHFKLRNSWGLNWGDKGNFYMPFAYLTDPNMADDFWVVTKINTPKKEDDTTITLWDKVTQFILNNWSFCLLSVVALSWYILKYFTRS